MRNVGRIRNDDGLSLGIYLKHTLILADITSSLPAPGPTSCRAA